MTILGMIEDLIPRSEIEFTFVRSSGPGGQNVNKINSKAVLRWNLFKNKTLTLEQIEILQKKLKLTVEGDLLITSDRHRDQIRNREDCLIKFDELIKQSLHQPKKRKKTKKSYSSKLKSKVSKQKHSQKKKQRRFSGQD